MRRQNEQLTEMKTWDEVCIVDDAQIPRMVTQRMCENYFKGTPIRVFENVDLALAYFHKDENKKRIIFLDLHMPDKDGWSFLDSYHPSEKEKIYVLSSSGVEDEINRANKYSSVDKFISKPITQDKLYNLFGELTY